MRMLNDKERHEIFSLKPNDITQRKLVELFAANRQREARFETNDRFELTSRLFHNKETIETTVGRYIWNMFVLPDVYLKKHGYVNEPMNSGNLSDLETKMANMLLTEEMKTEDYIEYMRKGEWLAGAIVAYISPSYHMSTVESIPELEVMKENLMREYANKIAEGDINTLSMIDDTLVAEAKRIMQSNPEKYRTAEWANAGVYNINNNYRKTNIATGLQRRPSNEDEYFYVSSNYMDGLEKKDYSINSNLAIVGGLSRGLDSAEAGYSGKKILGAMSTWSVDKDKVDCGTKHYLETEIPKGYESYFIYRWINENGKLVELTPNNIKQYVGKVVKLRSPMYCKSEDICQTCAGNFMNKIGIEYEGLAAFEIADVLVNAQMKAFHDSSIKTRQIDLNQYVKKIE